MATYGWGFTVPPSEEDVKGNWYWLSRAYLGFMYATDPLTRVIWDVRIAQATRYDRSSSRGGGGPSDTPVSTIPSKASSGRAMAQAKKSGGPRQRSQRGGRARGKCPKGHYWSYKKKKCLKSKF